MKKENTFLFILRLTLTLLLICAVVAGILATVNSITAPIIAAAKLEKTQQAIQEVVPDCGEVEEIAFTDNTGMVTKVYQIRRTEVKSLGYAVEVTPSGFGGAITIMVGVSADWKVLGISIISHAETPGLGAVAAQDTDKGVAFRQQFAGLIAGITIGDGENQIDALSGATISSQAIVDGVNAALECVKNLG